MTAPARRTPGTRARLAARAALALLALLATGCAVTPRAETGPLTVYLVRHAEKADAGADPPLTEAGARRAAALAETLRDARVQRVHSTDYRRTRATAAPAARRLGLPVEIYDPRDLPALADALRAARGRHLVVGHSNTTPELVALLGGEPGPPIDEPTEYDRLYILFIPDAGETTTALLRYGGP